MTSQQVDDELQARVRWERTRMLLSHVPLGSLVSAGFAILLVSMVNHLHVGVSTPMLIWLGVILVVALMRTYHALIFRQAANPNRDVWRRGFMVHTGLLGACWGLAVWMLPLGDRMDLQSIVTGSVTGVGAIGAFMLTADRGAVRLWTLSILLPTMVYCASIGSAYGMFGAVSLAGFAGILWLDSARAHRRLGELLRLRLESDLMASVKAQALDQAEQLSLAKGRFLATMSHEMRTPLHGILGLSRLLRPELSSQEAHQRLNLLQGAGQHLLGVINDVLDFSRLQAGNLELNRRSVDLRGLIQEVCALAEVNALDKGLEVRLDLAGPDELWVHADPDRLRQVLNNLLGNAVKFTERGFIEVRLLPSIVRQADGTECFTVEVRDTGIGIPAHEVGRVFDAFHQAPHAAESRAPGSGLGLSIAHQICQAMQGELTCESQPGVGSTFRCEWPLKVVAPASSVVPGVNIGTLATWPPVTEARSVLCGTVLLVEDNPVNAMVAQAELEQLGLAVVTADNGRKALEWLSLHRADLVFMDCHMPEMDGFEATRRIRESELLRGTVPTPIIALTASAQVEDRRECLSAGMDDHLAKPFAHGDLVRVVRRHLLRGANRSATATPQQAPQPEPVSSLV